MSRIVIVGGGIVGLSIARAALKAGQEVVLLEQGPVGNPNGASYDNHRMIRYHYGAAEGYTRMVTDAFAAWARVWDDLGETHHDTTGAISIGLAEDDYAGKTLATFRNNGIPHEILDGAEIAALCPHLKVPGGAWGLLSRVGGPLYANRIVDGLARWNREHGADIRDNTKVARVDLEAVTATLDNGELVKGDHLVVAAGAWLPSLLPDLYANLTTYRQALCYVEPPVQFAESWRRAPSIVTIGDGVGYTLPDLRGAGLKFGAGSHRRLGAPSAGFQSDIAEADYIIGQFAPYLHDAASYRPLRMKVGYYVMDATRKFRLDSHGRSLVVTNCDGQMFKFGPLLGEAIVDMFEGRLSPKALSSWAAGDAAIAPKAAVNA
ncbi:FAD-dependent oxidoreductase [Phyllobacterium sp. LjRoot231]|uniref:NAD(P)/FAD-dependent oxidoreductase n=1 Tax=Phyllobacterium sp. LjRoot231 TaxID=3342289 RepID=UPI003ECE056E